MVTLACGPYFSEVGVWASLGVLGVVKPLTYFAFIQAFRYRVSRDIPMTFAQAAGMAGLRTLIGVVMLALAAAFLYGLGDHGVSAPLAWGLLMCERAVVWFGLGRWRAGLEGRRLAGWTISGVAIDAAYDGAVGASLMAGVVPHVALVGALAVFIGGLHVIGRRESLQRRFDEFPHCGKCGYDLRGNLSGVCPECGKEILAAPVAAPAVASSPVISAVPADAA